MGEADAFATSLPHRCCEIQRKTERRGSAWRGRSGSHLILRGETYHYRRAVPGKYRKAFGCGEVWKSLDTTSYIEALRLEKTCDVEFESQLSAARDDSNPETRQARRAADILTAFPNTPHMAAWSVAYVAEEDREAVREITERHHAELAAHRSEVRRLAYEIEGLLPKTPLAPEVWEKCRADMLAVIRYQIGQATQTPISDGAPTNTLEWAYERWLRAGDGDRTPDSVAIGRRHFDAFKVSAKVTMLNQVTGGMNLGVVKQ